MTLDWKYPHNLLCVLHELRIRVGSDPVLQELVKDAIYHAQGVIKHACELPPWITPPCPPVTTNNNRLELS